MFFFTLLSLYLKVLFDCLFQEFETKIAKKLTIMLEKRQNDMFESFRKRIEDLQASNESWKSQAKELQKQVLDLTNQIQRNKRRQLTNGPRPIMRNMAIQVNEQKVRFENLMEIRTFFFSK